MILFPQFPQNDEIYKKIIPPAFFNILKEPLQEVSKEAINISEAGTQLLGAGKYKGVASLEGRLDHNFLRVSSES